ncbi:unnamed protein product [Ambrosiozyma monospora]|uniref:Unnamed protein product n=1 Tax=Ambrosiozyma monospora TaxID=43982 RepID=A0A9W6YUH0_AMBMO|nr:unnamed protein product [Ambrosiozyma monospora]
MSTRSYSIVYSFKWDKDHINNQLVGYSDASHAGDKCSRKSTTSSLFMFLGGPIYWNSRVCKVSAISSTEAEFVSMVDAGHDLICIRQAMIILGLVDRRYSDKYVPLCNIWIRKPDKCQCYQKFEEKDKDGYTNLHPLRKFPIMADNTPAIYLSHSLACHGRTRYLGSRIGEANTLVNQKWISYEYLETKEMLADILTKPVTPAVMNYLIPKILKK